MTKTQEMRIKKDWSKLAGEEVEIEESVETIYAFGSEIACLRLYKAFKGGTAEYSENLKTWYFTTAI